MGVHSQASPGSSVVAGPGKTGSAVRLRRVARRCAYLSACTADHLSRENRARGGWARAVQLGFEKQGSFVIVMNLDASMLG